MWFLELWVVGNALSNMDSQCYRAAWLPSGSVRCTPVSENRGRRLTSNEARGSEQAQEKGNHHMKLCLYVGTMKLVSKNISC